MKLKAESPLKAIVMVLFILCSGSQFGIENARYIDIVLFVLSAVMFYFRKQQHLSKRNVRVVLYFLAIIWSNYVVFFTSEPNINAYISYSIRLVSAFLVAESFELGDFEERLYRYVLLIALISLFAYVLRLNEPGGLGFTTHLGLFRTSNLNGTIRNAGVFWEPGAYQLFLNLVLFFYLKKNNFRLLGKGTSKKRLVVVAILILTIISTMSTTGYLLLLINFLTLYVSSYKQIKRRNKVLVGIPLLVGLAVLFGQMIGSDTVAGKFTGTGNIASTSIRMNDIVGSIQIILDHPFGMGHGTKLYYNTLTDYAIVNNSSGILAATCHFGILYGNPFVVCIFLFMRRYMGHYWLPCLLIILLTGLNENFYYYPVYCVFLFHFTNKIQPTMEASL